MLLEEEEHHYIVCMLKCRRKPLQRCALICVPERDLHLSFSQLSPSLSLSSTLYLDCKHIMQFHTKQNRQTNLNKSK